MTKKNVVAITGVAGYWGMRLANKLTENPDIKLIGIDAEKPPIEKDGLDFIQADIRNPLLVDLLINEKVDTLCHLAVKDSYSLNENDFDLNVMGTLKLLGAAVEAGVKKIIIKSSTQIYGAKPNNPGYFLEDHPLRGSRRYGYTRDMLEIETFINGFRRQHPEIFITTLRFANIIGPKADTPMNRLLSNPYAPLLLGFDPMMQFIHEDDVVSSLVHACQYDLQGAINVAADGLLPLNRSLRLAGRLPIQVIHPFAYWSTNSTRSSAQKYFPLEPDYLRYRWIADIHKMSELFNFAPIYTAEEALREMAGELRIRKFMPMYKNQKYDEERLKDTIDRRNRLTTNSEVNEGIGE